MVVVVVKGKRVMAATMVEFGDDGCGNYGGDDDGVAVTLAVVVFCGADGSGSVGGGSDNNNGGNDIDGEGWWRW